MTCSIARARSTTGGYVFTGVCLFIFGGEGRVATAQGKQGIWFLLFPDRENTGNFVIAQGKFLRHGEIFLTVFIDVKSMFLFTYLKKILALLCSA